MELSELLKTIADTNRLRILALLDGRIPCVCDLEAALLLNQSNLSRHLNRLRHAGLVQATKKGLFVYYQRIDQADPGIKPILDGLYEALRQAPAFADDQVRLAAFLKTKPDKYCG